MPAVGAKPLCIRLRPALAEDAELVRRAHVADRRAVLATTGWPAAMVEQMCEQQHVAIEQHIAAHHPDTERLMVEVDGQAVGRLCLDRTAAPWWIVDLVVVPEAQRRGIGTAALRLVLEQATAAHARVALHVGSDNARAAVLYRRLGFDVAATGITHQQLVWSST